MGAIKQKEKDLTIYGWLSKSLQNGKTLTFDNLCRRSKTHPFFAPFFQPGSCMKEDTFKRILFCIALAVENPDDEETPRATDISQINESMNAFEVFEFLMVDSIVEVFKGVDLFLHVAVTFILLREALVQVSFVHCKSLCAGVSRLAEPNPLKKSSRNFFKRQRRSMTRVLGSGFFTFCSFKMDLRRGRDLCPRTKQIPMTTQCK